MQCLRFLVVFALAAQAALPLPATADEGRPRDITIVAHRAASGYLPEHTQESKAMAVAQGADIIEQDLMLTRDDVLVVLHDLYLDNVTNVAEVFPGRARSNGRHYVIDFDFSEIQQLKVTERIDPKTGQAVHPGRFPIRTGNFRVMTMEEDLEFMRGLAHSTGRTVALYAEIKHHVFHLAEGKNVSKAVVELLAKHGYTGPDDPVLIQCFEEESLIHIRHDLKSRLRLSQLFDAKEWVTGPDEQFQQQMDHIASYADGVSPSIKAILGEEPDALTKTQSRVVDAAHKRGLFVHCWTFRTDDIPRPFRTFEELVAAALRVGVDGFITDFPDACRAAVEELNR